MTRDARLRAQADPAAEHLKRFQAHYKRLGNIVDEKERVRLAELIASHPGLMAILPTEETPVEAWPYPYAAEDYYDRKDKLA